jgi:hypothetical protein
MTKLLIHALPKDGGSAIWLRGLGALCSGVAIFVLLVFVGMNLMPDRLQSAAGASAGIPQSSSEFSTGMPLP